jgi:hypothetical protein
MGLLPGGVGLTNNIPSNKAIKIETTKEVAPIAVRLPVICIFILILIPVPETGSKAPAQSFTPHFWSQKPS